LEKKNKFFKVQETDLPPIIKDLPVHPIVEDNLEAFNAEIKQKKKKKRKKASGWRIPLWVKVLSPNLLA